MFRIKRNKKRIKDESKHIVFTYKRHLKMKRNRTQSSRFAILHIFIALGFTAILSSCYVQNITDDYKFLRQEARERVTKTTGSIDELKDDRAIYLINAQQVKDYCKQHSNVIIYNFSPSYIMNKNLNANDFVDMCKVNGVNALPIANSYLGLDKVRKLGVPLLMIHHNPYKTNKWRSYTKLFYKDVTNSNKRINNSKRFFSFKNGVYIGNFSTYEEALKSL